MKASSLFGIILVTCVCSISGMVLAMLCLGPWDNRAPARTVQGASEPALAALSGVDRFEKERPLKVEGEQSPRPEVAYFPQLDADNEVESGSDLLDVVIAAAEEREGDSPEPLELPETAAPIPDEGPELQSPPHVASEKRAAEPEGELRSLIRRMLPDADPTEWEVLEEEYRDWPPEEVAELLRIRKAIEKPEGIRIAREPSRLPPLPLEMGEPGHATLPQAPKQPRTPNRPFQPHLTAMRIHKRNIANANSPGFKGAESIIIFGANSAPIGADVDVRVDFRQGPIEPTDRELDVAVIGEGFFQLTDGEDVCYTRCGAFSLDESRRIVLKTGRGMLPLEPEITVPADVKRVTIQENGIVMAQTPEQEPPARIGRFQLARFGNPGGLGQRGNLFFATEVSGEVFLGSPASEGLGHLQQRALEWSNVNVENELAKMERLRSQIAALREAQALIDSAQQTMQPSVPSIPSPLPHELGPVLQLPGMTSRK